MIRGLDDDGLRSLDDARSLSLDLEELHAIRDALPNGSAATPTDVELETLAQTWSEHCAHKTFRARDHRPTTARSIAPLLAQLRDGDRRDRRPVRAQSAFVGNAGIVVVHRRARTIARQGRDAQPPVGDRAVRRRQHRRRRRDPRRARAPPTARSPSPTSCASARPTSPPSDCPTACCTRGGSATASSPASPTTATRSACRPSPARCCTTPATPPTRSCSAAASASPTTARRTTGPHAGDLVVVLGGRTGRDGIRGATFSSATMDATTGEVAGASVQIGDPIAEKLLIDVLAERRRPVHGDHRLRRRRAVVGGRRDGRGRRRRRRPRPRARCKYPGLEPWEIWLSARPRSAWWWPSPRAPRRSSQQRVRPPRRRASPTSARSPATACCVVRHGGDAVLDLDTAFLHDGRPQRAHAAPMLPTPEPRPTPTPRRAPIRPPRCWRCWPIRTSPPRQA